LTWPLTCSVLPAEGYLLCAPLFRFTVKMTHAASSVTFHCPSDFREIESSHATQPLHGDLLMRIPTH